MPDNYMARVRAVKAKYEASLLQRPNVVGVGVGLLMDDADIDVGDDIGFGVDDDDADMDFGVNDVDDDRPAGVPAIGIIVNVTHKVPSHKLSLEDRVPETLEGVPVQVQAVGKIRALKRKKEIR